VPGRRVVLGLVAALAVAGGGATGVLLAGQSGGPTSGVPGSAAPPSTAAGQPPVATPVVALAGIDAHGRVRWDAPLALTATHATLQSVTATDDTGATLAGTLAPTGWRSSGTLVPTARYALTATYADERGSTTIRQLAATAGDSAHHLTGVLSPGDTNVVGVGQPVLVTLSRPVVPSARAAVTARLSVLATPAQTGAWRWVSATQLHWRPKVYWKAGTRVHVVNDLARLHVGGSTWGVGHHTSDFTVGPAHVSTADAGTHTLTVRSDGVVVKVFPMSAGSPKYPSRSGVHLTLEKTPTLVMDSSTVGIPNDTSDGYRETVLWDVRLSYGGAFVHAAPWSVYAQGRQNVSHGCINLSTADAQWFFGFTRRGDVVDVTHSGVPPLLSDPGTLDWNVPWSQWASLGA